MIGLQKKFKEILTREKGQNLTEYALLLGVAVAIALVIYNSGLRDSAQEAYSRTVENLNENAIFREAFKEYATISNAELKNIDNSKRLAIDQSTIHNLANKFLGMSVDDVKKIFKGASDKNLKQDGAILFDYEVVSTGDNGEGVKINLRQNGANSASVLEAAQWLQGNYDTNSADYPRLTENKDAYGVARQEVSSRYFFSDDTIDKSGIKNSPYPDKDHSATIRAVFTFDKNNKVDSVTINMTRSVNVNGWKRENCDGLFGVTFSK